MKKDKLEKRLDELTQQRARLYRTKVASATDLFKLTAALDKQIEQVKKELERL